jgi:hypothetical protein
MTGSPTSSHPRRPGNAWTKLRLHFAAALIGFAALGVLTSMTSALWVPAGPWGTTLVLGTIAGAAAALLLIRRHRTGSVVRPENRPYITTGVLGFLLAVWMSVTAVGLAWASRPIWPALGMEPSLQDIELARIYLRRALGASSAAALPGFAVAIGARRTGWVVFFAVALLIPGAAAVVVQIRG